MNFSIFDFIDFLLDTAICWNNLIEYYIFTSWFSE